MQESICLECERPLQIPSDLKLNALHPCPNCQTDLEIVSLDPIKVDWPQDHRYDDWDGDVEDAEDDFDEDEEWLDDDEWFDDGNADNYSWMLAKQKRHQEPAELDRRRPPRVDNPAKTSPRRF